MDQNLPKMRHEVGSDVILLRSIGRLAIFFRKFRIPLAKFAEPQALRGESEFSAREIGPDRTFDLLSSVITSKPAIREQVKTGQWEAVRD